MINLLINSKIILVVQLKRALLFLIDLYQKIPGPWHNKCRFVPSCSNYMKESIIKYGLFKGLKLGIKRLLKCHPFGSSGYDPVPIKEELK